MCGIIGCVGASDTLGVLMAGLKNLEYRGYDSAGIALANQALTVVKREGELANLEAALEHTPAPEGTVGIGHTRWSTHGAPSDANAHPHTDCTNRIAVAHNGIIENYQTIKDDLQAAEHAFTSETDSEVVPHLIESFLSEGREFETAFRETIARLEGSYAICAICAGEDSLLGARQSSPLVLGLADNTWFVGSDVPAFREHTDQIIYLEDDTIAALSPSGYSLTHLDGTPIDIEPSTIEWAPEETGKGGYPHYMLKEIHEQPTAIRQAIQGRVAELTNTIALPDLDEIGPIHQVHLVACGTSYHAAAYAERLFHLAGIPATAYIASEYATNPPPLDASTLVIGITQSGETADTLRALDTAHRRAARTLAVTNVVGSSAARDADHVVFIQAGPEIGVAATKTFSSQVITALILITHLTGSPPDDSTMDEVITGLRDLPGHIQEVLDATQVAELAAEYQAADAYFFIGRHTHYPVALEGALKMKEITYKHAEGFAAGELKHGPLALVTPDTPVFAAITGSGPVARKTLSNMKEVETRDAPVIAVTDHQLEVERFADQIISIPETIPLLAPVLVNIQYQLLAYHTARLLDRSIDKPRHLAKSVTVE